MIFNFAFMFMNLSQGPGAVTGTTMMKRYIINPAQPVRYLAIYQAPPPEKTMLLREIRQLN